MAGGKDRRAGPTGGPGSASPDDPRALMAQAFALHGHNRLDEAAAAYAAILARFPDYAPALNFGGYLTHQRGERARGRAMVERSLALEPNNPAFLANLGKLNHADGDLGAAEAAYRGAIAGNPRDGQSHFNLAMVLQARGDVAAALAAYHQAVQANPRDIRALVNLGILERGRGEEPAALAAFRQAAQIAPDELVVMKNLAASLLASGKDQEAEVCLSRLLGRHPRDADSNRDYAALLARRGHLQEAVVHYRRALAVAESDVTAMIQLGHVLSVLGRADQGAEWLERALALEPDNATALGYLAFAKSTLGDKTEAIASAERATALAPEWPDGHGFLGLALKDLGQADIAAACFRRGLECDPNRADLHSSLVFTLQNCAAVDAEALWREHERWGTRFGHPPGGPAADADPTPAAESDRDPERRLRIGYLSPDFRRHSVACYLEPLFAAHDRAQVEVFAYSAVPNPDAVTGRFEALADHWRDVTTLDDAALAAAVRQDRIDILVDLAGHTAFNRVSAFGLRPAPIQVTWLGYPGTTGHPAIDYRISDAIADPAGPGDLQSSETVVRLESGFHCYAPPGDPPAVAPLPAAERGYLTFGSFNAAAKVTPDVVAAWAAVLKALPDSRLIMKSTGLSDAGGRRRFEELFAARDIAGDRLRLIGFLASTEEHMALYGQMDVALDSFPYNGTTTTLEALWMGVPTLTLAGERHAGRVGASLLSQVGLTDWIAASPGDLVEKAKALTRDRDALADLRAGLRDRLAGSSLCDAAGFSQKLESTYRRMWRDHCAAGQ